MVRYSGFPGNSPGGWGFIPLVLIEASQNKNPTQIFYFSVGNYETQFNRRKVEEMESNWDNYPIADYKLKSVSKKSYIFRRVRVEFTCG